MMLSTSCFSFTILFALLFFFRTLQVDPHLREDLSMLTCIPFDPDLGAQSQVLNNLDFIQDLTRIQQATTSTP
jgi:hypothetical protein